MQIKIIEQGESVGYGATFTAKKPTRLAIVFGGYADGLLRALSNSGFAYCGDIKVPLVGRVSMDSTIFDITHVPPHVSPSYIHLTGGEQSLDQLALQAGTIAYELLTSLGNRYERRYIASGSIV